LKDKGLKMKKIYKFLKNTSKYAPIIAEEIIDRFKNEEDKEKIEYNFEIDGEEKTIKGENTKANTSYSFDTNGETTLDSFKKALFDKDIENIKEGSVEEEELMNKVRDFILGICNLMTEKYEKEINKTVRKLVLGNKYDENTVPLKEIKVLYADIADYSSIPESNKYLLKIGKNPGTDISTDEVIKFVQDRQEETGMGISDIFSIEKQAKNPLFEDVVSIDTARKFLHEVSIYFFVDYSVVDKE
jgi:hypothetical protein